MAFAQKPDFVFRRNGRVHLNRRGASVQSIAGSRSVRINGSNVGYTIFRGSVKSTGYPLHSPVSTSLPRPCVTVCYHISTGLLTTSRRGAPSGRGEISLPLGQCARTACHALLTLSFWSFPLLRKFFCTTLMMRGTFTKLTATILSVTHVCQRYNKLMVFVQHRNFLTRTVHLLPIWRSTWSADRLTFQRW